MLNLGVVAYGGIFEIPLGSHLASGAATAVTWDDADFKFYKNGSTSPTSIAGAAITPASNFDSGNGRGQLQIDLSQDTTNFSYGSRWQVWAEETIDSVQVRLPVAIFRIETLAEEAARLLSDAMFGFGCRLTTTTGNDNGRINMTDIVDPQTPDSSLVGTRWSILDITDDHIEHFTITGVQSTKLFNIVNTYDFSPLSFAPAAGDRVWFAGFDTLRSSPAGRSVYIDPHGHIQFVSSLGDSAKLQVRDEALAALNAYDPPTKAELDVLGTTALATASSLSTHDAKLDTVKAKTDPLTFSIPGKVDSHITHVAGEEVIGSGTENDPWRPA
jgi:hypothetical protein